MDNQGRQHHAGVVSTELFDAVLGTNELLRNEMGSERGMANEAKKALPTKNNKLHEQIIRLKERKAQSRVDLRKRNQRLKEQSAAIQVDLRNTNEQLQKEVTNLKKQMAQSKMDLKKNRKKRHRFWKSKRAQSGVRFQGGSSSLEERDGESEDSG